MNITVPITGVTLTDLDAIVAAINAGPAPPPPPPPPPTTNSWVFYQGKHVWQGSWDFAATDSIDSGVLDPAGFPSLLIDVTSQWGGWQPYFNAGCQSTPSDCFSLTGFNYLNFLAMPSVANQHFGSEILSSGDTQDGLQVQLLPGPNNPAIGAWTQYKIPLSIYALTSLLILKFSISDQTGLATNKFHLANVGFSAT